MNRNLSRRSPLVLGAFGLILLASLAGAPAEAQTIHLFACKIVCGYEVGNVRLLNNPNPVNQPYEDLKPGNYATTCNLFNYDLSADSQPVFPYLAVEGAPLIFLGQVDVAALTANAYGCVDIANALGGPPANGTAIEGYLTLFTLDPDFQVDGVRTFESQNAFERHVLWSYDPFGFFNIHFQSLAITLPRITAPLPNTFGVNNRQEMAGTGAGGLGLGASIDVEDVPRIDINLDSTAPDDRERLPVEVREHVGFLSPEDR